MDFLKIMCLESGANIRMSPLPGRKEWVPGSVAKPFGLPRSFIVKHGDRV